MPLSTTYNVFLCSLVIKFHKFIHVYVVFLIIHLIKFIMYLIKKKLGYIYNVNEIAVNYVKCLVHIHVLAK